MPEIKFGDCPTCGGKLTAVRTVRTTMHIMRRKVCMKGCEYGIETYEIHALRHAKLIVCEQREIVTPTNQQQVNKQNDITPTGNTAPATQGFGHMEPVAPAMSEFERNLNALMVKSGIPEFVEPLDGDEEYSDHP